MSLAGLARHTSIYAIAPLVQRVLALVLVNLYTKELGTGRWGILSQTDLFLALLPLLVGTSLLAGLSRHYFLQEDEDGRKRVVTSSALALLAASGAGALLAILAREPIAELLFGGRGGPVDPSFVQLVVVAALIVPFSIATRTGIEYLQVQKRSLEVTRIEVGKTLLEAALKLWMILGLHWGVMGFLLAVLIGEALVGTALVGRLLWQLRPRFDWHTFKPVLVYALPLLPVGLFQLGLHQADKLMIEHLGPQVLVPQEGREPITLAKVWNGIYGLGYLIPLTFHSAVLYSFMRIWQPHVFGTRDGRERAEELQRVGTLVALGFTFAYAQVALFGREGVRILAGSAEFYAADPVVPLVALAYLCYALFALAQTVLLTARATGRLSLLTGLALALNLGLNVVLLPAFGDQGYVGAALATLVTFAALAAGAVAAASRVLARPFDLRAVGAALAAAGAASAAAIAIDAGSLPFAAGTALKVGLSLGLGGFLWSSLLPPDVRAVVRQKVLALRRR